MQKKIYLLPGSNALCDELLQLDCCHGQCVQDVWDACCCSAHLLDEQER
jgi:hypothetical protein